MNWFLSTGHKLAGIVIFATQLLVHWEDILDRFSSVLGLHKIIERRNIHMDISGDIKLAITLVPQLVKIVSDLKAVESDPVNAQAIADITSLVAQIKAAA